MLATDCLPLEVADVVALDPERRIGQAERLGQLGQGAQGLALVGQPADLLAGQGLGRVALGQFEELPLLAPPGHPQVDRAAAPVGQERLEVGRLAGQGGHQELGRDRGRAGVELEEEAAQDLLVGHVAGRLEQEDVAPDQGAVADDEQLDRGLVVPAGQPDQVERRPGEGGHLLALHRPLDRADLVAQGGRPLVVGPLRGGFHLGRQAGHERLLAALEEELDLGDVAAVGLLRDRLDAGALAALDVVEQAGPGEGPLALADVDRAGPEREEAPDEVHRLVDRRGRGVRPEVAAAVVDQLAGPLDPREIVGQGDLDVGVALVVLEPDVEPRPVALDQVRLEEERLGDRIGQGHLDVGHPVDDAPDPVGLAVRALLLPVAPDPVAQALGLADVQDVAPAVLHQVHAGTIGQLAEGRLELGSHGPIVPR